ncbi:Putative flippase GtrA (transmembrane translocase of bactoprenol-linked glucose) [Ornithinimicrobium cerasi]|uniref:Flippase GtrA (Transmembrane translocase of bactoprenol-linked glucose) n=2 Tax=Ornithinimicrobium cerasi TaxID=2248773 RepID=A0A285VS09_9MICO|nr:Putative flippase GtrA (transmembrane translocase of bactoprenol-linked glucose) [Ornithinimicrobium cerasi]
MTDAPDAVHPVASAPRTAADRFATLRNRVHAVLPPWARRVVPATAVGFAALSSFTYAVDLLILALAFDVLGLPYPLAVTIGYVIAFGLSFLLNRWLNFQVHGHVGRQTGRYVLTVLANYLLFILVLASTLEAVGVNYLAARLVAGACEAVFMYLMMRGFVFRAGLDDRG